MTTQQALINKRIVTISRFNVQLAEQLREMFESMVKLTGYIELLVIQPESSNKLAVDEIEHIKLILQDLI